MTHVALRAAAEVPVGVVDLFAFPPLDEGALVKTLKTYRHVITLEEGFIHRGGMDVLVMKLLTGSKVGVQAMGFDGRYLFEVGNRAQLHKLSGIDEAGILQTVKKIL